MEGTALHLASVFAFSENMKYAAFTRRAAREVTGSLRYHEAEVDGLEYPVREAINAWRVEPAPLLKKGAKDSATVPDVTGKAVEFSSSDAPGTDEIPY